MYFPVQFSVQSTRKKYLGYPFLLQGAQKAEGGARKKVPDLFFFFFFFFRDTKNFRGGALFVTERGGRQQAKLRHCCGGAKATSKLESNTVVLLCPCPEEA